MAACLLDQFVKGGDLGLRPRTHSEFATDKAQEAAHERRLLHKRTKSNAKTLTRRT